ncbi:16S rRNA (uracil1498-N3)-methyltransferase [Thermosyntropha lipolytica DSM 11003]|uniref:Ribosomal RNA small subunit methyltransferase E n=1 Tax=Thermosyntropha lipolytica DSM 11003 TaxID=1123382 RepID=A0A1M5N7N7_9FIRM|nr:16S rRNA (uracil(1498)-N(3))-methyltransferase [Thermosyntropha lipolytica]SHG85518.1 16S rRNA (uracil1498-N3)-methyltransferase [Thermosyntropha lipolytica DSM 11003]
MHRFFVSRDNIKGREAFIDKEEAHHIQKVLRLKEGDRITLFDGQGWEYYAFLQGVRDKKLVAWIEEAQKVDNEPPFRVNLVQGIPKGDKMELIIQKAVELGVYSIYPVLTERTVVTLKGEKETRKVERWRQIALEACKQCRRNIIPEIKPVISLRDMLELIAGKPALMFYENEQYNGIKKVLQENRDKIKEEVFLLVGPEGGFAPGEADLAREKGIILCRLGPRILRTETASLAGISIILYELGDLG